MKAKSVLYAIMVSISLCACTSIDDPLGSIGNGSLYNKDEDVSIEKFITFEGVKVRKPVGVPSKVFEFKTGENASHFLDLYYSRTGNARLDAISTSSDIPASVYYGLIEKITKKYLDINKAPYKQEKLDNIYRDFPDFKTEEDIQKYSHTILMYYNRLISNDLKQGIIDYRSKSKGGRVNKSNDSDVITNENACERQLVESDPVGGLCYYNARFDAINWTQEKYGNQNDQWRGNAFKHAVWNAQGVRKMIIAGNNQWYAYDYGKQIGTAHEKDCTTLPGTLDPNNENNIMDLHNNVMGRTYVKLNVSTNIFGNVISWPSENSIKNDFFNGCNLTTWIKIGNGPYISSLTYNNIYALADANYVDISWFYCAALTY